MRRRRQERHFRGFVTPPQAALGLLPLDPRLTQAVLPPNNQERLIMIGLEDNGNA
jgi:hypothetical protein